MMLSNSGNRMLTDKEWKDIDSAYAARKPYCQYCDSYVGHDEIVHTGDLESLYGYEIWFCCHSCRDKQEPCESFFKLEKQPD